MNLKLQNNGLSYPKVALTGALCLTGLLSMIYVAMTSGELFSYFYCLATVAFVALPLGLTVIFRWRMNFLFYAFFSAYTLGPLLGAVYNFYYYTTWWDDLLHIMAGTVFAVVGAYLATTLNKGNKTSYLMAAVFGVLVSISIAVVWEIYEYSSDVFLGSDMQADTIIDTVITKINRTDGGVDVFEGITATTVNGQSLGVQGYLDIGLIDTMTDMIVETLGALVYFIYAIIDRDRHPLITRFERVGKKNA